MAGHSVDDYLETIYFLAFPIGEYRPDPTGSTAIAARVAEMLGVSRASAGEMLKRLEADGLVERGEQKEAILTDAGSSARSRSSESTGSSSASSPTSWATQPRSRMCRRTSSATRSPTTWSSGSTCGSATRIAAHTVGRSTRRSSRRRTRSSPRSPGSTVGQRGEIVRLAEHDGDLLHWFYDEGFTPGTEVVIREAQPAAGQFKVCWAARTSGRSARRRPQACTCVPPYRFKRASPPGGVRSDTRSPRS